MATLVSIADRKTIIYEDDSVCSVLVDTDHRGGAVLQLNVPDNAITLDLTEADANHLIDAINRALKEKPE